MGALLIQIAATGVGFLVQIVYARSGGPTAYATYARYFALAQVLAIVATGGYMLTVVRDVPLNLARGCAAEAGRLVRRAVASTAAASLVMFFAVLGLGRIEGHGWQGPTCAGLLVVLVAQTNIGREVMRSIGPVAPAYLVSNLLPTTVTFAAAILGVTVLGLRTGLTGPEMLLLVAAGAGVSLCVQQVYLHRATDFAGGREVVGDAPVRNGTTWSDTASMLFAITILTTVISQSDVFLVGETADGAHAGAYAAAARTGSLVGFFLLAVNSAVVPMISRAYARSLSDLRELYRVACALSFYPCVLAAAFLIVAPLAVLGLFGSAFGAGARSLQLIALGDIVNAATGPIGFVLILTGFQRRVGLVYAVAAAAQVGGILLLVPRFGIAAAALTDCCVAIAANATLAAIGRASLGLRIGLWSTAVQLARARL